MDTIRAADRGGGIYRDTCGKCGARRVDLQLGLEATPDAFVAGMVAVFREVRRVLRDDGTAWVNLGDAYAHSGASGGTWNGSSPLGLNGNTANAREAQAKMGGTMGPGLKPKDLIGIPWRVALALQADGWTLRDAIIWAKAEVDDDDQLEGSAMPGSQRDRCTSAYETVFQLAKRPRYYYDHEGCKTKSGAMLRNVWRINPEPTKIKHFATFPRELARRAILLSTSEKGVCPACGAGWVRVASRDEQPSAYDACKYGDDPRHRTKRNMGARYQAQLEAHPIRTLGWRPACTCNAGPPVPATVLDCFCGSGTSLVVANALGRNGIGLDLSAEYLSLARRRIERPHAAVPRPGKQEFHPLFGEAE